MAGLPYFVHGIDAGLRSAILGAPGWIVLSVCLGGLALSRWRAVIRVPEATALTHEAAVTFLARELFTSSGRGPDGRPLH